MCRRRVNQVLVAISTLSVLTLSPLIELVELLDGKLNILVALLFPYTRFDELTVGLGLGEVESEQVNAKDSTEPFSEALDQLAGVLAGIGSCLLSSLLISQRTATAQSQAHR